ncbi:YkgJ family cysteine cluster protein [Sphingomonas sp. RB1R13]|uniref:YkgJ family cysteine cluster protein n=1 Tax=Sphingomonas sp. RB1R13 TaxID=3096159 RepID=UPI002FC7764D
MSYSLCMKCGLCCAGALFDYGELDEDEVGAARAVGLDVFERSTGSAFRIACSRLEGSCCSIYGARPRTCRKFRCKLLRNVEAGEVTIDAASEKVAEVWVLIDKIILALTDGETLNDARWRWRQSTPGRWTGNPAAAQFHLDMTLLNLVLDRYFRLKEHWVMINDA